MSNIKTTLYTALKAIEHVLKEPTPPAYIHPYLGQHRQEHPVNAQHTIFGELPHSKNGEPYNIYKMITPQDVIIL